ncbi:hypothetical protein [Micromonospora sp. WMMD1082]|uniref:hypothetical protein n=1 Tax=Micromonospora sp. WMMD1082 TaxID=3016104 RepID=UPI002416A864|nr:hypothetical protein [Micromonospora sp. WMMD1082]MDG4796210.1 hypothetical protein [Micromonospora sp. WMMD1082]
MAALANGFEGGVPGATVTTGNSGGPSGDPWTLSTDTVGGACVYTDLGPAHGVRCMAVSVAATGGAQRRGWAVNAGDSTATQYFRFYVDPASITGTVAPLRGMNVTSSGQRFRIQVTAAGVLSLHNNANTAVWTSAALAAGPQWRVEVSAAGSTTAAARVRIYLGDAEVPAQDSGPLSGLNLGGPIREVWFGQTAAATNVGLRLDDCGWSDTAPLGSILTRRAVSAPSVAGPVSLPALLERHSSVPLLSAHRSSTSEVTRG